jgi:hypothetical protein
MERSFMTWAPKAVLLAITSSSNDITDCYLTPMPWFAIE